MDAEELTQTEWAPLALLADELASVVDRLQADWQTHGVIDAELANQVHDLRERAEGLFSVPP